MVLRAFQIEKPRGGRLRRPTLMAEAIASDSTRKKIITELRDVAKMLAWHVLLNNWLCQSLALARHHEFRGCEITS